MTAESLATEEMRWHWSDEYLVLTERRLWVAVMELQRFLDVNIPADAVVRSRNAIPIVNMSCIRQREMVTKHDVKARLEEFCYLAGHEYHHLGMTSADAVDNVMLIRMRDACRMLGLDELADSIPFRGIKGPVGTQQDQLDLLGSEEKVQRLERALAHRFGFQKILGSVGQVYPRSIDFMVGSTIKSRCVGIRHPAQALLSGYVDMLASISDDQWNEGDVSSSVVRRVAIPGMFFAADCLLAFEAFS